MTQRGPERTVVGVSEASDRSAVATAGDEPTDVSPAVVRALVERVDELEDELEKARQVRVDLVARIHELEEQLDE